MEFSRRGRATDDAGDGQRFPDPPPHGNRRVTVTRNFSSLCPRSCITFLFQFSWVQMLATVSIPSQELMNLHRWDTLQFTYILY